MTYAHTQKKHKHRKYIQMYLSFIIVRLLLASDTNIHTTGYELSFNILAPPISTDFVDFLNMSVILTILSLARNYIYP